MTNLSSFLQGLPRNILDEGPFLDTPDWSFADGRPGVPRYGMFLFRFGLFLNISVYSKNQLIQGRLHPEIWMAHGS
jgi:hypothetical protein